MAKDEAETEVVAPLREGAASRLEVPRITVEVLSGGPPGVHRPAAPRFGIGTHASNAIVLDDRTVSRFHCEIVAASDGVKVEDAESKNGTWLDGVRVQAGWLREGSMLALGNASLRVSFERGAVSIPLSDADRFGELVGRSPAMRSVFAVLERSAASDATVLLEGETGTGKEAAAQAIHDLGKRAEQPFLVVDCGAIPENLLESELFGHERGAFTGANERRIGAFEAASGGTVFLDEIGELPPSLQPKLLRVLEDRTIRRLGSTDRISVDVRVIAATNRQLRREVNEGRFRPDLFFRLAVLRVELPSLRERAGDIPLLARTLLERLGASDEERAKLLSDSFLARLSHAAWPGNVRELRNHLERCLVMREALPLGAAASAGDSMHVDPNATYAEARRRAIETFERSYLPRLLDVHGGNVSQAARASGIDRVYLHRMLRRHGLR
jgi:DNA-binding NtrC family response regulator